MKGPSLDAIRKFKQQQEQKKREEDARKVQEKLSTLEHRAAQGDKKAKVQLKKIELVRETRLDSQQPGNTKAVHQSNNGTRQSNGDSSSSGNGNKSTTAKRKPNNVETDFEELMRLAKNNTNEIRTQEKPQEKSDRIIPKQRNGTARAPPPDSSKKVSVSRTDTQIVPMKSRVDPRSASRPTPRPATRPEPRHEIRPALRPAPRTGTSKNVPCRLQQHLKTHQPPRDLAPFRPRPPIRRDYDDDYDDDEDEYESDGFVVDEDDDEVREELSKTLKSVFRYDRRRCDLREQELDRQYKAIGRVSTFEDLEKEERRAARLAAAEDAKALREEEERKRLKKIRLKGLRD